mmetsp:Transcript_4437/g.14374  ORF Transcript_4437/g.14374 Transcript_4437/m.14374 type:complete len:253 (+) Transcript_4437:1459-2217(+)
MWLRVLASVTGEKQSMAWPNSSRRTSSSPESRFVSVTSASTQHLKRCSCVKSASSAACASSAVEFMRACTASVGTPRSTKKLGKKAFHGTGSMPRKCLAQNWRQKSSRIAVSMITNSNSVPMAAKSGLASGSGAQHACIRCANRSGMPAGTSGRTCSRQTALRNSVKDLYCSKGSRRVTISHSTMPKEYTSAFSLKSLNIMTSGAIHNGVPLADLASRVLPVSVGKICERPKSHTFTRIFSSTSRLDVLRSR